MRLVRCTGEGRHYYNADEFSECPECLRLKQQSAPAAPIAEAPKKKMQNGTLSLDDLNKRLATIEKERKTLSGADVARKAEPEPVPQPVPQPTPTPAPQPVQQPAPEPEYVPRFPAPQPVVQDSGPGLLKRFFRHKDKATGDRDPDIPALGITKSLSAPKVDCEQNRR